MRSIQIIVLFALISCTNTEETTEKATGQSRHSDAFNQSIQSTLKAYYSLTEAFVRYDSATIPSLAADLQQKISLMRPSEDDSTSANYISQAQRHATQIAEAIGMEEKRHALHELSENLFTYLNAVEYDQEKLYYQQCPMAFNDSEPGYWLSAHDSIRNPYLGLFHPQYGKGMLKCGENKEVINHLDSK
ncbi:MAG: DUF3347 domain-containing protein [Flavisolibacter sp.]|jgi:hypothetical protein|nr:DUF3347 domain-containing protein [Flavisolibacter sp.]